MEMLAPHLEAFFTARLPIERGASVHTRASYADCFRLLVEFAGKRRRSSPSKLRVADLDAPTVLAFLAHLENVRGNSPATRNARLAAIKSFMRFIEHRAPFALDQIARVLAIPTKRSDEPLVPYLTDDEWHSLVDSPDVTTWCGLRDRALLYLAVTVGLRVSELVGAKLADISLGTDPTIVVQGKGRRYRELPLWKSVAGEMRKWLASRGESDAAEIFIGQHRRALTRSGVEAIVRRHERNAQMQCPSIATKRVSPHVLRHTCAMIVLRATGDLRKVALWLGHASIQTTEIYTRADPTEKLAAIETQLPPSLRPGRFRDADRVIRFLKMQATKNA